MNQEETRASFSGVKLSEYELWSNLYSSLYETKELCKKDFLLYQNYRREIRKLRKEAGFKSKDSAVSIFTFAWFRICGVGGERKTIQDFTWFCKRHNGFVSEVSRNAYKSNPAHYAGLARKSRANWSDDRRKSYREYARNRARQKAKTDALWRVRKVMRTRIGAAISRCGGEKSKKTMQLVGCSMEELKSHIEKQFKTGMTWSNYGKNGWHIDHIKPCASFDLTNEDQAKACFHFTNLQPLWWFENLSKGDRF